MNQKIRVGLIGYGKAGKAVATIISEALGFDLCWIVRRSIGTEILLQLNSTIPIHGIEEISFESLLDQHPVDALVDFSSSEAVHLYGEVIRNRRIMLVTAISAYSESELNYVRSLGQNIRVMCSPNITLGINFLIVAANLLRKIAPFADVEILEQHFKEKPEISGTARKIAEKLCIDDGHITSLRLGGIVGHHEVIFGFPHQTVRLVHSSIRREAFGTGAVFALSQLITCDIGFYTFDDLLLRLIRAELVGE
ncbi:dihydrodipicolinate reductase C-terminal domain-containing protein [Candidatus Nitrotoga arctica]|uniref:4-hydroxy-tetrahydrodipicolinate reductase n=1 Tax=Candidatus Nitrotoga arctica TaxID=453162 RepID=A0ABM8YVX2_9PROT|nr:dihydrodipicolinate reductase C-terminal domain-containing protein [Candidatus Nitrotoga arctica]CAG9931607.1 Dihydrodipicolinate reductase [Candidatus Nitrotoga arctica]